MLTENVQERRGRPGLIWVYEGLLRQTTCCNQFWDHSQVISLTLGCKFFCNNPGVSISHMNTRDSMIEM
ncbi:hypothetical protein L6164_036643 [Bauhinia variegata]|uniref:Uncharacterized protein n=1 Tax=Bauhinia variegata TaxID=167791 RepID=A0ACB9KHV3_BAUVA|nr:hypothetical protein L6164_036643 [Bauhinia variegata]